MQSGPRRRALSGVPLFSPTKCAVTGGLRVALRRGLWPACLSEARSVGIRGQGRTVLTPCLARCSQHSRVPRRTQGPLLALGPRTRATLGAPSRGSGTPSAGVRAPWAVGDGRKRRKPRSSWEGPAVRSPEGRGNGRTLRRNVGQGGPRRRPQHSCGVPALVVPSAPPEPPAQSRTSSVRLALPVPTHHTAPGQQVGDKGLAVAASGHTSS